MFQNISSSLTMNGLACWEWESSELLVVLLRIRRLVNCIPLKVTAPSFVFGSCEAALNTGFPFGLRGDRNLIRKAILIRLLNHNRKCGGTPFS